MSQQFDLKDLGHILNNVAIENGESSSQAINEVVSADHDDHIDPQKQLPPRNSEMIFVNNLIVNPMVDLVFNYNSHEKNIINLGVKNDSSLSSNSYSGRSYMDEMAAMKEETNVDFPMRGEKESLMQGPTEIKKNMDLMEMILQGKI